MKTVREIHKAIESVGLEYMPDLGDIGVKRFGNSILSALKEAGLVVVPVEATREMRIAGHDALEGYGKHASGMTSANDRKLQRSYHAMLAAYQGRG